MSDKELTIGELYERLVDDGEVHVRAHGEHWRVSIPEFAQKQAREDRRIREERQAKASTDGTDHLKRSE